MVEPMRPPINRRRDELKVWMLQRRAGCFAVVFEQHDRLKPYVAHQVVEAASQEFNWLAFQFALPPLVFIEHGARRRAE